MPEVPLVMPKMSMTMESGEVIGWRKRPGDPVEAGEVVCEVLTDKVDMEVEAPVAGTLARIVADAQATVPVGQPLAFISTEADDVLGGLLDAPSPTAPYDVAPAPAAGDGRSGEPGAAPADAAPSADEDADAASGPPAAVAGDARTRDAGASPSAGGDAGASTASEAGVAGGTGAETRATPPSRKGPVPALPGARRRAAELGVRIGEVAGTGPRGAVAVADVERAANGTSTRPRPSPVDRDVFGTGLTPVLSAALAATRGALDPVTRPAGPGPATPAGPGEAGHGAPAPGAAIAPAAQPDPAGQAAPAGQAVPGAQAAPAGETARTPDGEIVDPGFADALAARRRSVRAAVSRTMTVSATVPQFTVFADLDLEPLAAERDRIGWTALLVRALATALRGGPTLNALSTADGVRPQEHVGVALAADTPVGLLAPVVRDPDRMPVADLDATIRRTVDRARTGRLTAQDLDGATVTVSNLGGWQVTAFQALLTPPQAAVLSVGAIAPRPVVTAGGGLAVRTTCTVGLTVDHRAADGADAARLLADLRALVAQPRRLLG